MMKVVGIWRYPVKSMPVVDGMPWDSPEAAARGEAAVAPGAPLERFEGPERFLARSRREIRSNCSHRRMTCSTRIDHIALYKEISNEQEMV